MGLRNHAAGLLKSSSFDTLSSVGSEEIWRLQDFQSDLTDFWVFGYILTINLAQNGGEYFAHLLSVPP